MKSLKLLLSMSGIAGLLVSYAAFGQTTIPGGNVTVSPGVVAPVTPIRVCPYESVTLRPGVSSDEVKTLQSILSQDTAIYPQGVASGYYGNLTTEAVKRLQQRAGIPATGIVDEDTRKYVFPCATIRVTSPNGGETWRVGETKQITWTVDAPYYILHPQSTTGDEGRLQPMSVAPGANVPSTGVVRPFFQHLSIDLMRYDGPQILIYPAPVYYHIGSASLYGVGSYSWTIPSTIADSSMYKVRIGLWKNVPQPIDCKDPSRPCPLVPSSQTFPRQWQGSFWDESDNYFAISGGPTVSPVPIPDQGKLVALRAQLAQALESIQKAIQILNQIIGVTPATQ